MNWTLFDFLMAGALLSTLALGLVLSIRFVRPIILKFIACAGVTAIIAFIWAEGAVGIL